MKRNEKIWLNILKNLFNLNKLLNSSLIKQNNNKNKNKIIKIKKTESLIVIFLIYKTLQIEL